jgi:hypothetical protein
LGNLQGMHTDVIGGITTNEHSRPSLLAWAQRPQNAHALVAIMATPASPPESARTLQTSATKHLTTHPTSQTAPLPFFHPTRAQFHDPQASPGDAPAAMWRSRASRKRRFRRRPVHVAHHHSEEKTAGQESRVEQRLQNREARFKVGLTADVSFWVAIFFVLGSCAWVRPRTVRLT